MTAGKRAPVSRLATLVSLVVLAVAGFVFGLVAGGVSEDPGLFFGYLTGRTQELVLAPETEEDSALLPDVAASSPSAAPSPKAGERPRIPPALPRKEPESAPQKAAKAAPAREGRAKAAAGPHSAVQVGAFAESGSAEELASSLRKKGYDTYISPSAGDAETRWRVRVGPVATREEAERVAARLARNEKLPTWVLSED